MDGDLFNLSTYRLSHNSSTCSYIMKGHWLLRNVPLEKKCGFTLLLLRLDQCEHFLCNIVPHPSFGISPVKTSCD